MPKADFVENCQLRIDFSLFSHSKSNTNPEICRKMAVKKIYNCSDNVELYADGSFQNGRTSDSVVQPLLILWVPSHLGITRNEHANKTAKEAINIPLITEMPCLKVAITCW